MARKPKASSKYASRLPQKVNAKAQPGAPLKAHRVQTIVTLMTSGLWEPGITTQELAKKWNVDTSTVRHDAANARAVLLQNDEDTELIRFQIKALLHKTIVIATDASDESMPPRDRCKALTDTAIATARIFGIEAPKKIDIKTLINTATSFLFFAVLLSTGVTLSISFYLPNCSGNRFSSDSEMGTPLFSDTVFRSDL